MGGALGRGYLGRLEVREDPSSPALPTLHTALTGSSNSNGCGTGTRAASFSAGYAPSRSLQSRGAGLRPTEAGGNSPKGSAEMLAAGFS